MHSFIIYKKNRENDSAFVVEGIKFVGESINENADIKFVLISESSSLKDEVSDLIQILKDKLQE